MSQKKSYVYATLIYYAIVTCIFVFVPWFRENYMRGFGSTIVIALVFVAVSIIPSILSYVSNNDFVELVTALYYMLVLSTITMLWFLKIPDPLIVVFSYPCIGSVINIIPFVLALKIGCRSLLDFSEPIKPPVITKPGETAIDLSATPSSNVTKESEPELTGYMNNDVAGYNSPFNNNPNDFKLDYYKINDTDFTLVHERLFGSKKLEFRKVKDKGFLDHDYDVITDTGKRYYADINPKKGFPGCADLFVYIDGRKIDLYYKELHQF